MTRAWGKRVGQTPTAWGTAWGNDSSEPLKGAHIDTRNGAHNPSSAFTFHSGIDRFTLIGYVSPVALS